MKQTNHSIASAPAAAAYELSDRRYVVSVAYHEDNGASLAELLLRIMVNDGKDRSATHDAD